MLNFGMKRRNIMVFGYEELREYVKEDFQRFYEMGFNEKEIVSAILNEYEHGKNFCQAEYICILIFTALNYAEKEMDNDKVIEKIQLIMKDGIGEKIREELGNEYAEFLRDFDAIRNRG